MDNKDKRFKLKVKSSKLKDLSPSWRGEASEASKGEFGLCHSDKGQNQLKCKNTLNPLISFSLIELIVGITISIILMVSIGVFVSSGMQNIFLQQKSLQNISNLNDFALSLYETIGSFDSSGSHQVINSGSIIFKRNAIYDNGGFAYIGITTQSGVFCDDPKSESMETKHIFIKNFIPFEEGENISNMGKVFESKPILFNGKYVKSLQKEHKIVDENGNIVVGRGIFGDELTGLGTEATKIYLNSPTGLALDKEENLYISDTLNNRILYLFSGSKIIHKLLDEDDGLLEPTGLYIESNSLFIANSGSGEILRFSSSPEISEIPVFSFLGENQSSTGVNITLLLNGEKKDLKNENIILKDFGLNTEKPSDGNFKTDEKSINSGSIIYKLKTETYSGGTLTNTEIINMDFEAIKTYTIEFNEIDSFWEAGNYTIKLKIGNFEKEFFFFTQGDEKIYTKNDNTLKVVESGNYPSNNNLNLLTASDIDIANLPFDKENDIILKIPIESLEISEDGDLVNIILKYYRNYNCYNLDENNKAKVETFISKINLK